MTKDNYVLLINFFKKNKKIEDTAKFFCMYSPLSVVLIYFISIIFLYITQNKKLLLFIIIPAANFIFVSVLRKILNKPRPYDVLSYTPLIKFEQGKGKSFPSRHTSSAFIIAMASMYINTELGFFVFILAILIGTSRIISGIHYPKDVLFGAILSIIFGYIGFFYF